MGNTTSLSTNPLPLHTMLLPHPHFTQELTHTMLLPHLLPFTPQLTNPLLHFMLELTHTMLLLDPHSHTMPATPLLPLPSKPSKFVQYFSTNKQTNKLTNSKKAKEYFCHYVFCPTALSPHCGKKGYIFFTTIDHCGNELFRVIQLSNTKNSHLETPKRYYYLNPFIIEKFELHMIFAFSYFCGTFQLIFRRSLRKIS